MALSVLRT